VTRKPRSARPRLSITIEVHRRDAFVRKFHTLATDRLRDRVVLFGGAIDNGGETLRDETWEFHASTGWRQIMPLHRPSPRTVAAMAYDEGRGRVCFRRS
jgi:hypothetical protein